LKVSTDRDELAHVFQLALADEELDGLAARIQHQDRRPADDLQPLPQDRLWIVDDLKSMFLFVSKFTL
jgi:hypothetical protein